MQRQVRLAWGRRGARAAASRGDTAVIVDVLRFTSTVATAVAHGGWVKPVDWSRGPHGSLSPLDFLDVEPGGRFEISSPNGATLCALGGRVVAGSLLNARATAAAVDGDVTVVAAGERWPDDTLRVALEDYLGAGAILAALEGDFDPDARVCAAAFRAARGDLEPLLLGCPSGREHVEQGTADHVRHCARLDLYDVAVVMRDGWLQPAGAAP